MNTKKYRRSYPFPLLEKRLVKSPFRDKHQVHETLHQYHQGKSIGFSRLASLKSMGLLPRSHGDYELGSKYRS